MGLPSDGPCEQPCGDASCTYCYPKSGAVERAFYYWSRGREDWPLDSFRAGAKWATTAEMKRWKRADDIYHFCSVCEHIQEDHTSTGCVRCNCNPHLETKAAAIRKGE